jgi:hypothetical protein
MAQYRVTDGQSLFDVALQKYGNVSSVIDLVVSNLDQLVNINNGNITNKTVDVPDSSLKLVQDLLLKKININTSNPIINDGYSFDLGFSEGFFS